MLAGGPAASYAGLGLEAECPNSSASTLPVPISGLYIGGGRDRVPREGPLAMPAAQLFRCYFPGVNKTQFLCL